MPTIVPPIVTPLAAPAVSVTSVSDVSYDTIQASIGAGYSFRVENIYQYTNSISQLLEPVGIKKFNKFGDKEVRNLQMMVDPYQRTSALNQTMLGMDYTFDGNNGFYPMLEANATIKYRIDVTELGNGDLLSGNSNFEDIEFLDDYIIDF